MGFICDLCGGPGNDEKHDPHHGIVDTLGRYRPAKLCLRCMKAEPNFPTYEHGETWDARADFIAATKAAVRLESPSLPVALAVDDPPSTDEPRLAHLVLKPDYPVALCGYRTTDFLGTSAPAMDRCPECLRIASERGLGRPGWGGS